jgi:hypothetical protein
VQKVLKAAVAVVVAVTSMLHTLNKILAAVAAALISSSLLQAAVLPEDRADVMFHSYSGGGVTIDGPSLLVRKDIASTVSVSANYYVDTVSGASIDVEASGASEYSEERIEYSVGADYLYDKSILSAGFTSSIENDYEAETWFVGISQDFFGDLSTISIGYAAGSDTVMQNGNDSFEGQADRQNFQLGLSQIISPNLLMNINYETATEEGYLNNPYRSYRFVDPANTSNTLSATEVYPNTRTSDAVAIGGKYFLPYRAVLSANYRYFTDDWDIDAHTYTLGYTHPLDKGWIFDLTYRFYQQKSAYFYSDLHAFQAVDESDFRGRDKELSEFNTQTLGFGVSYQFAISTHLIEKSSINLQYDFIQFDYDNFSDTRDQVALGEEPLYEFDAEVIRLYLSIWY